MASMKRKEQIREILFILFLLKLFYGSKIKRKKQLQNFVTAFLLWCHQEMSFISKWLYIFALKNRNKRNLPLLLHLISTLFCSVSQSRVPTFIQSYCFILIYQYCITIFEVYFWCSPKYNLSF